MVIRFNLLVMETLFMVKVLSLAPGHSLCIYLLRNICSASSVIFFWVLGVSSPAKDLLWLMFGERSHI